MSESRAVKMAILDKSRQLLVVLYQRCPKKMSKNAERPASSGRGSGEKERPTATSVNSGRGSGEKERPTATSVNSRPPLPPPLKKAGPIRIRLMVDLT